MEEDSYDLESNLQFTIPNLNFQEAYDNNFASNYTHFNYQMMTQKIDITADPVLTIKMSRKATDLNDPFDGICSKIYQEAQNASSEESLDSLKLSNSQSQEQQQFKNQKNELNHQKYDLLKVKDQLKSIHKDNSISKKRYQKNIAGNIIKRGMKIIFHKQNVNYVQNACEQKKINYIQFYNKFNSQIKKITGPNNIFTLFQGQNKQVQLFKNLLKKALREKYLLAALKDGKMQDLSSYIKHKNRYWLYFTTLL